MPLVTANGTGFLHIPKTGGTWVRYALARMGVDWADQGRQHADHAEAVATCNAVRYFTVVRHPLEWYASYWAMRMAEGWGKGGYNWVLPEGCVSSTFQTFVRLVVDKAPGLVGTIYNRYAADGVLVLKTPTLVSDLPAALTTLGERFDVSRLPAEERMNRGASIPSTAKRCQYDEATVNLVLQSEAETIRRYGLNTTVKPKTSRKMPCGHCNRPRCHLCRLVAKDPRYRALWEPK